MRVLDLFSGIGGFSLGLERAGMTTVAFCEIDPYCQKVLRKHWPEVPIYDDITTLTADTLARDGVGVDVICGGFPCQDVSIAGSRGGIQGEQSGLWREFRRLSGELRPRFIVVENTTGLLDCGMGDVLGGLAEIGYDAVWHCIPASAVGAPHDRDRVWIIAYSDTQRRSVSKIDHADNARRCLSDINRFMALRLEQPHADALATYGTRIPDRRDQRAEFIRAALRRKDDGLSAILDRIGALGNAVVPQIPEMIGRAIMAAQTEERSAA